MVSVALERVRRALRLMWCLQRESAHYAMSPKMMCFLRMTASPYLVTMSLMPSGMSCTSLVVRNKDDIRRESVCSVNGFARFFQIHLLRYRSQAILLAYRICSCLCLLLAPGAPRASCQSVDLRLVPYSARDVYVYYR